jgi:uncharacterized protein (DUF1778 family)
MVHFRLTADDLKAVEAAAKASQQNLSEWIRSAIHIAAIDQIPWKTEKE